jgi:hypothetical protein
MSKPEDVTSKAHKTAIVILGVDDEADRHADGGAGHARLRPAPGHAQERGGASPFGGFEPAAVRSLNEQLFDKAGASWDDASPFHPEWRQSPGAKAFVKHAVSTLEDQFGNAPLIALGGRDLPRLFPLWAEALRLFGCNVRPIVMLRNPLEVGQRAQDRQSCSPSLAEMLWVAVRWTPSISRGGRPVISRAWNGCARAGTWSRRMRRKRSSWCGRSRRSTSSWRSGRSSAAWTSRRNCRRAR